MDIKVLYEDNHIIAVFKPAGLLTQGDISGTKNLMDVVKEYLKDKYKKPGNVFLGLVHRLDRNVSGIVLFGKTSKGASRLSEQFRNNEIKKIYHGIVEGKVDGKGRLIHYLKKDEETRTAMASRSPEEGYERSELEYETICSNDKFSLLKILLITGRFHQIRAQFSAEGHPLVGDKKYLPASRQAAVLKDGSIALCATEIQFETSTTGEIKNIRIDYPGSWSEFLN